MALRRHRRPDDRAAARGSLRPATGGRPWLCRAGAAGSRTGALGWPQALRPAPPGRRAPESVETARRDGLRQAASPCRCRARSRSRRCRARHASAITASSMRRGDVGCRREIGGVGHADIDAAADAVAVAVEAVARLSPSRSSSTSRLLNRRRPEWLGPAEPLPHAACRGEVDVDSDEVRRLERAHRVARTANRRVDRLDARLASLLGRERLERERPVDAVDDEAGRVDAERPARGPSSRRGTAAPAATNGNVAGALTTSTRRITGAGLKKCSPRTRSGRAVASAIAAIERALVFVARIASGAAAASRTRKRCASARGPRAPPRSRRRPPRRPRRASARHAAGRSGPRPSRRSCRRRGRASPRGAQGPLDRGDRGVRPRRPERVLGLHFFNPAPVMRSGRGRKRPGERRRRVAAGAAILVARLGPRGRSPASTNSPGFIVNRVNRPFTLEALAAATRGARRGIEAIDAAVRGAGYPMGPFELMDLVGIRCQPRRRARRVGGVRQGRATPAFADPGEARRGGAARAKVGPRLLPLPATASAAASMSACPTLPIPRHPTSPRASSSRCLPRHGAPSATGSRAERDIDTAMRLGAGHRVGPFERTRELGGPAALVAALRAIPGPRFEIPPLLLDPATAGRPSPA